MVVSSAIMLTAIAIFIFIFISRSAGATPRFFGYTIHIVVSGSMEPDIQIGDFVLAEDADIADIQIGDDVIFNSPDPNLNNMPILHRVQDIIIDSDGKVWLVTKGINNPINDEYHVSVIIGRKIWKSTGIGKLATYFSDVQRLLLTGIFAVALIVAIKFSMKIFSKYAKNNDELKRNERLRNEAKAELAAQLKAMLANVNFKPDPTNENGNVDLIKPSTPTDDDESDEKTSLDSTTNTDKS